MLNVNDAMNFALSEKYKIISLPQALKNLKISNDSQGKGKKSFVLKEMNAFNAIMAQNDKEYGFAGEITLEGKPFIVLKKKE